MENRPSSSCLISGNSLPRAEEITAPYECLPSFHLSMMVQREAVLTAEAPTPVSRAVLFVQRDNIPVHNVDLHTVM